MTRLHAVLVLLPLLLSTAPGLADPLDPATDFTSSPRLAPLPDGGFVAIWHRDRSEYLGFGPDPCVTTALVGGVLDDAGRLIAPPREITLPEGGAGGLLRVATTDEGNLALARSGPAGLHVGPLTDELIAPSASLLSACTPRGLELVSAGRGFWVVWSELCGAARIRAQRLGAGGRPVDRVVEVAGPSGDPGVGLGVAGHADGGLSVAWVETVSEVGRRVLWSRFREDGSRASAPFPVSPGADAPAEHLAAAPLPDGGVVFAWRSEDGRLLLRTFAGEAEAPGTIVQAATEAGGREGNPRLAVTRGGLVVAAWNRFLLDPLLVCPVRVFDLDLQPVTDEVSLGERCWEPVSLAISGTGALLATWTFFPDAVTTSCRRSETTAPAVGVLAPAVPPITSPELPDFRFWVRVGGDEPSPRIGVAEPECIPETVCVSGALPGRTEVFLRIVGPKPNGRLWPTITRFTTSRVEVWIEQVSTGLGRYYRLPGAMPGSQSLDGRFDRQGFPP